MKLTAVLSLFVLSSACKMAPPDDTAEDNCLAICLSELRIELADTSETFQIMLYGDGFNTLNLACPDGITAGGPGQVTATCDGAAVELSASGFLFPEELTLSIDSGEEQVLAPNWVESDICGTECNSADVSL
jgi:hypothetical protein